MSDLVVFTIGFTQTSAEKFFATLVNSGVKRVVDVRLNNTSQLSGFAKQDDLRFFLQKIGGIDYVHLPELAPTQAMLDEYKKQKGSWERYEQEFLALMQSRRVEEHVPRSIVDRGCFLCSEHEPHHCHRRLVAEYLHEKWGGLGIQHLR